MKDQPVYVMLVPAMKDLNPLHIISQLVSRHDKPEIPKSDPKRILHKAYLKPETFKLICQIHRYPTKSRGLYQRFADDLGVSRQHARGLALGAHAASPDTMYKVADLLGLSEGECMCQFFTRRKIEDLDPNHPCFNQAKLNGERAYTKYSDAAILRRHDYEAETE